MQRDMKAITAGVIRTIKATEPLPLPTDPLSLPDDPSESFGDSMRRVILWQAGELDRLAALVEVLRDCDGADEEVVLTAAAKAAEEIKRLNGIIEDMPLIQRCRTCDDADSGTIYCRKCYYKLEAVKDDAFDVMKNQFISEAHGHKEMSDKADRLQAIVDKYPKTKDGVTATPLMRVYFPPGHGEHDHDGIVHVSVCTEGGTASVTDAYSTRAAAQAAKEKT